MNPVRKFGLELQRFPLPSPTASRELFLGLAEAARPSDIHEELAVFDSELRLHQASLQLEQLGEPFGRIELLQLEEVGLQRGEAFHDYAIVTRNGRIYLDCCLSALFSLHTAKPGAESGPALLQLEEHLIARTSCNGLPLYAIDRQLADLAERIARAYGCGVEWHEPERFASATASP
ncbi:hypothetical protein [Cohnella boryungensis]|uniref:Uncharacterized protein n=1 Tax=Cohnella boryungensis TaxID=768479 RepID=A0ABV8SFI1_9BACL